ncbi:hypothetical protein QFC21_002263 [Naganishia friedmannii]|uniref:Uncharacterized protein n=1 Tax=Naganishia friedmannii TaxID=89922 RepID=A0ACC2VYB7_9TREE|nr:hypothetical protein QFC21_002263 [Naganishia friedmannii]
MDTSTTTPTTILHQLQRITQSFHQLVEQVWKWAVVRVLRVGGVPRHVAFVMDGNRRWARGRGWRVGKGHEGGFEVLKETLSLCVALRIKYITVYAFSIDNFKRPKEEVDGLLELTRSRLKGLCEAGSYMQKHDIRVSFLGRRDMLPPDVLEAVEAMERDTSTHHTAVLNVCCPYTSRDEVTTAIKGTIKSVETGEMAASDISPYAIARYLGTNAVVLPDPTSAPGHEEDERAPDVDILVRTSDVRRLSDFLMWQTSSHTQLHFIKTLWPEFGMKEMAKIMLAYQRRAYMSGMLAQHGLA